MRAFRAACRNSATSADSGRWSASSSYATQHARARARAGVARRRARAGNGLVLLKAGLYGNVIRNLAPLVITDAQLAEALDVLEGAIEHAVATVSA